MKILVTCGYDYSKHTIAMLRLLQDEEMVVDKCVIVRALSLKRAKFYYRQLDKQEFLKKLRDRILSNYVEQDVSDEMRPIDDLMTELGITSSRVSEFCRQEDIACKVVTDLNSPESLEFVGYPDLGIYSGGGILKKQLLERFSIGVLNCHGARLPEIRGFNTGEWSILLGVPLMNTLHFMVRALDLGPIIMRKSHDYSTCRSIDQLRGLTIRYAVHDLVDAVKLIEKQAYSTISQKKEDGKQYFAMHPILKNIVDYKLSQDHA